MSEARSGQLAFSQVADWLGDFPVYFRPCNVTRGRSSATFTGKQHSRAFSRTKILDSLDELLENLNTSFAIYARDTPSHVALWT
jgi:hypothetical protein